MNRKRKKIRKFPHEKPYMIAMAVCLLSAFALLGVYSMQAEKKSSDDNYLVDLGDLESEEPLNEAAGTAKELEEPEKGMETATGNVTAENYAETEPFGWDNVMDATDEVKDEDLASNKNIPNLTTAENEEIKETEDEKALDTEQLKETAGESVIDLNFSEESSMKWPVTGNVLLNFSMDKTIYFPTLEQYKYNSSIVVESPASTPVLSAYTGRVKSIASNEVTGTTAVVDVGNGYSLTYGQLQNVIIKEGDVVESGKIIGYVAEPTKYYSVEGSNLYFELMKDGVPVNPMSFLE